MHVRVGDIVSLSAVSDDYKVIAVGQTCFAIECDMVKVWVYYNDAPNLTISRVDKYALGTVILATTKESTHDLTLVKCIPDTDADEERWYAYENPWSPWYNFADLTNVRVVQ